MFPLSFLTSWPGSWPYFASDFWCGWFLVLWAWYTGGAGSTLPHTKRSPATSIGIRLGCTSIPDLLGLIGSRKQFSSWLQSGPNQVWVISGTLGMVGGLYACSIFCCPAQRLYPHSVCMKGSVNTCVEYIWSVSLVLPHPFDPILPQISGVGDFWYSGHDTWPVCVFYLWLPHPKVIST